MGKVSRIIAGAAAAFSLGIAGLVAPAVAPVNSAVAPTQASAYGIPNKVHVIGKYGHVVVKIKTSAYGRHLLNTQKRYINITKYPYGSTYRSIGSAVRVTAFGEGNCRGRLYANMQKGKPDKYLGYTEKVPKKANYTEVYVKKGSCSH
jgi:hypothetical protein